jgi:hypothetical protein
MSFHKRYFDKENIFTYAKSNEYEDFNMWIVKPDAHISKDQFSTNFISLYFQLEKEDRIFLYFSLSNTEEFVSDLIKCIRVCSNENNLKEHSKPIKKYISLFFNKWPDQYFTYKNLINKQKWKKK